MEFIESLWKFTALAPLTIIIPVYFLSKRWGREFNAHKIQMSQLCRKKCTVKGWHTSIVIFSTTELFYVLYLVTHWHLEDQVQIIIPLLISIGEFMLIPLVTTVKFPNLHTIMMSIGFSSSLIAWINLSLYQLHIYPFIGITSGILTTFLIFGFLLQLLKYKTVYAFWEYIYLFGILTWNFINLIPPTHTSF